MHTENAVHASPAYFLMKGQKVARLIFFSFHPFVRAVAQLTVPDINNDMTDK